MYGPPIVTQDYNYIEALESTPTTRMCVVCCFLLVGGGGLKLLSN